MKAAEIRELSLDELKDKISVAQEELNKLELTHAVAELENPIQLRAKRRDIARLKTDLRRRELAAQ
ncbi:50S ribosomal protein L29 [Luteibaculum oceani]|uniref:Large ribosomal subunit protein uL29 n=1 Tax=Luteibaculum oceani TaxID=1294296 RepID=A0A5C6UZS9_9FLAO|nr:50S ribosomal protein L29 [Luteibaculum oceani]TXC78419.1 50S ribosomal protein L29 [Luteibaculum oceani]